MRELAWSLQARRDLEGIRDFLVEGRPDLWLELLIEAKASTDFLLETPGAGSPIEISGLRKWRIGKTPYLIFYRFSKREVRIIRIHHASQDWRVAP